jgi:hypothetical protein
MYYPIFFFRRAWRKPQNIFGSIGGLHDWNRFRNLPIQIPVITLNRYDRFIISDDTIRLAYDDNNITEADATLAAGTVKWILYETCLGAWLLC